MPSQEITLRKIMFVVLVACAGSAFAHSSSYGYGYQSYSSGNYAGSTGQHYVDTYSRSNGTVVQGHYQTNPNDTKADNWSTKGNQNPYTGQWGTKSAY